MKAKLPSRFPVHTGTDLRALLGACHADPDDDTPRLALADWLQEHDDPRGECVRLQCQLAALPAGDPRYDDLMTRHEEWWRGHRKRWEKEGGALMWDAGPHDRGLPTFGHYEDESVWLNTDDVQDPANRPHDPLSRTIAEGWPGMTWVLPIAFAEFDSFEDAGDPRAGGAAEGGSDLYEPFRAPPWAGSPAPVGIVFPDGMPVNPEHIERASAVPNLRGISLFDTQSEPRLLPHLARLTDLTHLDLGTVRFGDAGVRALAPLTRLRTLISRNATLTNAGAAELAKFTELRELRLEGGRRLTAAGYKALAALTKLEVLELGTADDAAVRALAPLGRLRVLNLSGTGATGAGVERFPLLTHLNLEDTPASDAGLAHLAALARLRVLDVDSTQITGATLARLPGLKWLRELYASQVALRDRDLVPLEPLKQLETLSLRGTQATEAALKSLKARLKKTDVW